jgi:hypothetical protein
LISFIPSARRTKSERRTFGAGRLNVTICVPLGVDPTACNERAADGRALVCEI